mmetsp:Transcript_45577/g.97047  ORF Transcript_45577/g.97047 Transcript_45577/m.97047 type:complete len:250 (+) Transcript_45577:439-1188(+)
MSTPLGELLVLMAREAVSVRLEVDWHPRVGLLGVGVDAALNEPRSREAILAQVLSDPLAAAAAVVDEDGLAVATQRLLSIDGPRRPRHPLLVWQPHDLHVWKQRLPPLLLVAEVDHHQPVLLGLLQPGLELKRRHIQRHSGSLNHADHMPAEVAMHDPRLAWLHDEGDKIHLRDHQPRVDPAEVSSSCIRVARAHRLSKRFEGHAFSELRIAHLCKLLGGNKDVREAYACCCHRLCRCNSVVRKGDCER